MRETRPSGSVRGVRSDPYPYRDTLTPHAEGMAVFLPSPTTALWAVSSPRQDIGYGSGGSRLRKNRSLERLETRVPTLSLIRSGIARPGSLETRTAGTLLGGRIATASAYWSLQPGSSGADCQFSGPRSRWFLSARRRCTAVAVP